jgi:hypothetical protein
MALWMRTTPPALPDTDHPPVDGQGSPTTHHTVRLIPRDEAAPMLAEQTSSRLSADYSLQLAHQRLGQARADLARAKSAVSQALDESETARDHTVRTRVAYERARADARRCELALRQQQRWAEDAKLALRQAYERVAHIEGLNGSTLTDPGVEAESA